MPVLTPSRWARHALAVVALCCASAAAAQTYPDRPIRMIVGFPPGGGVDLVARLMAAGMTKVLKQSIVVENRSGAAGNIATEYVAKAPADGYTILMGNTGSLAINPSLYPNSAYDTLRDFRPVVLASTSPLALVVHPEVPAKNLKEFLAMAKREPGKVSFGTGGSGSIAHLSTELLMLQTGTRMLHVPYRGGTPAITDLMAKQLQMVVEGVPLVAPLVLSNKLRALAVTSAKRSPVLPDVPTAAESGYPDFVVTAWYGIVVPKGTPDAVVERLNAAADQALADPDLRAKLAQQGSDAAGGTPADFSKFLAREVDRWGEAVKRSGATVQ
ncbi:Bug family tripartite tricarboxylate transporter substrate binding protein [Bordetella genomosp. 10]|nr:tripartite tricarboxylate transporter substrate binding protein [Bordetella genomosp. 10]